MRIAIRLTEPERKSQTSTLPTTKFGTVPVLSLPLRLKSRLSRLNDEMSLEDRVDKHRNDISHAGTSHPQYTLIRTVKFGTPHHVSTWKVATDHSINFSKEPLPTEWERVRVNVSRIRRILHNISEAHYTRPPKTHDSGRILQSFVWFPPALLFLNFCGLESEAVSEDPWNTSTWPTKRNEDGPTLLIPLPS